MHCELRFLAAALQRSPSGREFMLPHDARVGFARTLDLIRRFAVVTGWQDAYDLERWQAQSGTEL